MSRNNLRIIDTQTAPDFLNSEESKRNLMLAPANNQDLTPLNVVSSVTFTNFTFAVVLYTCHIPRCHNVWIESFHTPPSLFSTEPNFFFLKVLASLWYEP